MYCYNIGQMNCVRKDSTVMIIDNLTINEQKVPDNFTAIYFFSRLNQWSKINDY